MSLVTNQAYAMMLRMAPKKSKEFLNKEEYDALLAFYDIAKDVFEAKLEKFILFGRKHKGAPQGNLDVLLLFSSLSKEDIDEISQIAHDLTENTPIQISPISMDQKTFQSHKAQKHQLIKDIESTGCEFP